MQITEEARHWERVYAEKDPHEVSWYEPVLEHSLALIAEAQLDRNAAILDVGGGASTLASDLLRGGYTDITVADISATSMARAKEQLGQAAERITWVEADIRSHDFGRRYDLWHDRALFHFMVQASDRQLYLETLRETLHPRGHVVIATFGPQGPTQCSGLPVSRYSEDAMAQALGAEFELLSSRRDVHHTPSGGDQQLLYVHLRRKIEADE
jgi:2-polyprenyl-3-methyl-5-hydroxy-6-metoxy-1,4-benzoquinol methylase